MAGEHQTPGALSPVKRALLEIRELRAELGRVRGALHEPIAIIGLGLRLPGGVRDAVALERLLWSGTDAVTEIPDDCWNIDELYSEDPDAPGKMTTRFGAFIDDVDMFDAEFFGISPREAASMDPAQRLLLEVSWHALEHAGVAPAALAGSRTGVYLGTANNDYGRALLAHRDDIDAYVSTGNAFSVLAGRLSYQLGLQGPSVAVDTACSSSLVALHLAMQALRLGECDLALVGGVNLVLTPEMNINFSKARMMAADGRCKTFDARADGYVRGEGCAVVVLRRLSDAIEHDDRVLAQVLASSVNQDGRSSGLTAPNGPAQEAVLRDALAAAGLSGSEIGYVEAHGTGTSLGDPIEVRALTQVMCDGRAPALPLAIGSIKTNIGHLEAAAGLAGLLKVVIALQRREVPPHLHFESGNPHIDWSAPIRVPTEVMPWNPIQGRRIGGVSSFGFSGTNAHIIVEEAPAACDVLAVPTVDRPVHLLALSARHADALAELAGSYQTTLSSASEAPGELCHTANAGRSHFEHRLAALGEGAAELSSALASFSAGIEHPGVVSGLVEGRRPRVAFLFTGHGAQHAGMGRTLYDTAPVFKRALDECAARLKHLEHGLLEVLFDDSQAALLESSAYAQPATFAIEYAVCQLWKAWGVTPEVVLGHSLGEYAAACVAGLLSLDDALEVVAERGRLTDALPEGGAMGAVFANPDAVMARIRERTADLVLAAFNGPEHAVVSGDRRAVQSLLSEFEAEGVRVRLLRVPYASHSPRVEPALPAFRRVLERVRYETPNVAIISNVTGDFADANILGTTDYWLDHMRRPVLFAQSIKSAVDRGITHFIEVGPHPVLSGIGAECISAGVQWLPSMRRDGSDWRELVQSLAQLYVAGAQIDWEGFDQGYGKRRVVAPSYPFRRQRHWARALLSSGSETVASGERWARLSQTLARQAERGPLDLNAASYAGKWELLARLTLACAQDLLVSFGLFISPVNVVVWMTS